MGSELSVPVPRVENAPPRPIPKQQEFFPRKVVTEYPKDRLTADYIGEADADDTSRYFMKDDGNGSFARASEWFCYEFAERVGFSAPPKAILERKDGSTVFGSRKIHGLASEISTQLYLQTSTILPHAATSGLGTFLSRVYAYDMVLHNVDRHFGNFLRLSDDGSDMLYIFDFGRALFWQWPWNGYPEDNALTRKCGRVLRTLHGFDFEAAVSQLELVGKVAKADAGVIIGSIPAPWLGDALRGDLFEFLSGDQMQTRICKLTEGLRNGSLL
jgi:hypothetical protein